MTDAELIQLHGGSTALARRLKMDGLNGSRRVNNWKRRGIPAKVKLDNPWLTAARKRTPLSELATPTKEAA